MADPEHAPFRLPRHLLWEYDPETFDYDRHYRIAIERVIERGGMAEWVGAMRHYGAERIREVARTSRGLSARNRDFALLFVRSPLVRS